MLASPRPTTAGPSEGREQWTRYRFDRSGELEEEQHAPPGTDFAGASEDEGQLGGRNLVSFGAGHAAAAQLERDQQHAAAIFGGEPVAAGAAAPAAVWQQPQPPGSLPADPIALAEADGALVVLPEELVVAQQAAAPGGGGGAGGGGGLSWRERALAAQRAKQRGPG